MKNKFKILTLSAIFIMFFAVNGCSPKINLFPDYNEPLKEATLSGSENAKILVVPVSGVISDRPARGLITNRPSVVQEVVSALDMARKDENIRALILKIDTPGGSATGSDILYKEINRYKADTGVPVVVLMMDLATSGGYYAAMAGDYIIAHPTTVTGSIGVIFYTLNVSGLFDKVGVDAVPVKSGKHKDMGSPFRDMTEEEQAILQSVIDEMYDGFVAAVVKGRKQLSEKTVRKLADGRIYTAKQALENKLIDRIGYTGDAIRKARELANLNEKARVIIYRRNVPQNDNIYNPATSKAGTKDLMIDFGISRYNLIPHAGFYYIWDAGVAN